MTRCLNRSLRVARLLPLLFLMLSSKSTSAAAASSGLALNWSELPPLPDANGFAGPFAGVSGGGLLVAGGANFPKTLPWEGGQKVWYDLVFVLPKPDGKWLFGFRLPRPVGYGVSVTTTRGVLCAGGGDAKESFRDTFLLRWHDDRIELQSLPLLPQPLANGCGALVGDMVYLAGGIDTHFYQHHGFDWHEIQIAAEDDLEGDRTRGASTITQQLVKNLFFGTGRSILRKGAEVTLVPVAEFVLGKQRILEIYLNVVEWGRGIYGAESACRYYDETAARNIGRQQAARLAAILPAPLKRRPERMNNYSAIILKRMGQMGW